MVLVKVFRVSFIFAIRPPAEWDRLLFNDEALFVAAVTTAVVDDVVKPEEHSDPFPETGDDARGDQMS